MNVQSVENVTIGDIRGVPRIVGELATLYLTKRVDRGELATTTVTGVRKVLWSFTKSVGYDRDVARLTRRHVERWMESGDWSPGTRRTYVSTVRVFCQWLRVEGYLKRDPFLGVSRPRQPKYMPRGLGLEHVEAVLAVCPDSRARLMVSLMVQEGLRCCEVAWLETGNVDGANRLILVRGKGKNERVLPVSDETWGALVGYLHDEPATGAGPLVRSRLDRTRGISPDYVSDLVGRWMAAAGAPGTPHALRHTAATDMLRAGAHLRDVQRALGHQSLSSTQRYLPWLVGDLREAMGGRRYSSASV